jgi:hypothetical protein
MVGMIIGKLLMKILKNSYNPNLPCWSNGKNVSCVGWNHMLQAWFPYINEVHAKNKSRHVRVTSWVFDANMENCGALWSMMDGVNVWVFFPSYIQITFSLHDNNSTFLCFYLWSYRALERAHVTSKFVHLVCKVNMVGLTPITEWENVFKKEQYDECIKKFGKTWYNFTIHAMIEILFKVNYSFQALFHKYNLLVVLIHI